MNIDDKVPQSQETFKLACTNYPSDFILDKAVCKTYFRQFGKVKKLTFKPKLRTCTVEYLNKSDFLNALNNAGEFNGQQFSVCVEKTSPNKPQGARRKLVQRNKVSYVDNLEIDTELEAMGGHIQNTTEISNRTQQRLDKAPKLKRLWKKEEVPQQMSVVKKKIRPKVSSLSQEQIDLIKLVKSQATTVEEKYRVLDARDKLIRLMTKKLGHLKSTPTVGTCPDMCPEKERLMRETQHQVSLFEQNDMDKRTMNANKAVKQYSRSSADQEAPLPHELRPVGVLQMTMDYLMTDIMDLPETNDVNIGEWYHFLWDRTRGIRKDITQQALCCQGSVELVEQCARFHIHCSARLVAEDPSVFDQKINTENLTKCLQTLKYMYHDLWLKGESCPNEAEFRAYIILLNLNDGNFMWEVQELHPTIQKSPEVKFALAVYSSFEKRNYVKFFKLINSTTYLNACILVRYFVQVRVSAIETLLKCFTPPKSTSFYPVKEIQHLLAFDDLETTVDFLQTYGINVNNEKTHFLLERNAFTVPEFAYLMDRTNLVENKRLTSVGAVVAGKNIHRDNLRTHQPKNSFDNDGFLIFDDILKKSDVDFDEQSQIDEENAIFERPKAEITKKDNIFTQKSLFVTNMNEQTPIFPSKPIEIFTTKNKDENPSIFGQTANLFVQKNDIFTQKTQIGDDRIKKSDIFTKVTPVSSFGGFKFDLPVKENIFVSPSLNIQEKRLKEEEETRKRLEKLKKQEEEELKRLEEERDRITKELEEEKERERLEEIRRVKQLEEEAKQRKKQNEEEERRKKEEEQRRDEKQREEIESTVKSVLETIIKNVDAKLTETTLTKIRRNLQRMTALKMLRKWHKIASKRTLKRKAIECSPVWIRAKNLKECADDFQMTSENHVLLNMKRYKHGKPLEIEIAREKRISRIDLHRLTYNLLRQRMYEIKETWLKHVFWKITISLPDDNEMHSGAHRLEDILKSYIGWSLDGDTVNYIEDVPHAATYCVEKQIGFKTIHNDSNGYIFIAKTFTSSLQMRIFENLKHFGVYTAIPVAVLLQEESRDCEEYLNGLRKNGIVSGFMLCSLNVSSSDLIASVECAVRFLARNVSKTPTLEMDTLSAFAMKYLCSEVWKKANSYAKWNSEYRECMKHPNLVIKLYNEGLSRIREIVLDKNCWEYTSFPTIFKQYFHSKSPDFLPCNYRYFPDFCRKIEYLDEIKQMLSSFELPLFYENWPPKSKNEILNVITRYCNAIYVNPKEPILAVYNVLTKNIKEDDFKSGEIVWSEAIEILGKFKISQQDFSLERTEFQDSVFKTMVVVYDVNVLREYESSDWFYRNNPLIEEQMKKIRKQVERKNRKRDITKVDCGLDSDFYDVIAKAEKMLRSPKDICVAKKDQIEAIDRSLQDLEDSIRIIKKMDGMNFLKKIVNEK